MQFERAICTTYIARTHLTEEDLDPDNVHVIAKVNMSTQLAQAAAAKQVAKTKEELVPPKFHEFLSVFDQEASERFPPSRACDHAIHLKPDFVPKRPRTPM